MTRYAMIMDTRRCVGCDSCTIACKVWNDLPLDVIYNPVVTDGPNGIYPNVHMVHIPLICMHCAEAPCVKACPTGASKRDADGIVWVEEDACIGCRACVVACPYGARHYHKDSGVVKKCTFCKDRVRAGGEPYCVQTCHQRARVFGDLDDPESEASVLLSKLRTERLFEGLGTDPQVYYIFAKGGPRMRDRTWSWPIASYLFLGGLGGSLAIVVAVSDLFFNVGDFFAGSIVASLAALALGCLLLLLELGRPSQGWRVFSRQHSALTFGAWSLALLIIVEMLQFGFWCSWFPWSGPGPSRDLFSIFAFVLGWCVLVYTGIELSSMRGRPFWNTPALPLVFILSGVLNGVAMAYLLVGAWPGSASDTPVETVYLAMQRLCLLLGFVVLVALLVYVLMMHFAMGETARRAANRWLSGQYAKPFWLGLVGCCLVAPLVLLVANVAVCNAIAAFLLVASGVFIRFLFLFSDDRDIVNGFEKYMARLPEGDEAFISANW